METVIIDYGMGNLLSVQRAFEKCGSDAVIIDNPLDLREAEHIVLPGVGAFPDAMNNLRDGGWIEELNRAVLEKETPILGICLGMQLLAERGYEVCDIEKRVETPLFDGIEDGTNYYFVHSYHFKVRDEENIAAVTPYCGEFVSAVAKDHIVGTQFHPEKSQKAGFRLIKNFLAM